MVKRMLIDAIHPEETRAVVLDDHHLVDFDFETSTKRQLKGNIYLAKVTRVEPSLQAAFIEYGGNRHGFLAFSEIHPDYFQIPQADRALLEDVEREAAAKASESDAEAGGNGDGQGAETVTTDADEEASELAAEQARRRARLLRSYKIQEVIKRRQILLVQVVKEERGNKGAALTTYLSLAGRYCVLMPNTPRGGGISRKIADVADRRRLKSIAQELEVPAGMGLIIRTAGMERSKAEIKRDYEYLLRLWNEIRETTLQSIAPKLIYEEGDLIKRAMRDLYSRDIEEVLVEGDEGYRSAKRLMTMLMPSRARLVKRYEEEIPLFFQYRVEDQLDAMHSPVVQLPSGGSIVIHTTEALTAIDVNSGRSTRERHIDETAVKTNLEAADEVARQLRLRDLAGLIVIDFIDMAEGRHQRAVEKRLRDALKSDRARIQMGKISQFGLMELSRQRLRASLQELSSQVCPHCAGLGVVRSTESCALQALRAIQEEGIRHEAASLRVILPPDVAFYVLNQKRDALSRLEQRYAMRVLVQMDDSLVPPMMRLEMIEKRDRTEVRPEARAEVEAPAVEEVREAAPEPAAQPSAQPANERAGAPAARPAAEASEETEEGATRRRRKRRRRRRRPGEAPGGQPQAADGMAPGEEFADGELEAEEGHETEEAPAQATAEAHVPAAAEVEAAPAMAAEAEVTAAGTDEVEPEAAPAAESGLAMADALPGPVEVPAAEAIAADAAPPAEAAEEPAPAEAAGPAKRKRRPRKPKAAPVEEAAPAETATAEDAAAAPPPAEKPARRPRARKSPAQASRAQPQAALLLEAEPQPETVPQPEAGSDAGTQPAVAAQAQDEPLPVPEPTASAVGNGEAAAEQPAPTDLPPAEAEPAPPELVGSDAPLAGTEPARDESQPARQGWWSRWVR